MHIPLSIRVELSSHNVQLSKLVQAVQCSSQSSQCKMPLLFVATVLTGQLATQLPFAMEYGVAAAHDVQLVLLEPSHSAHVSWQLMHSDSPSVVLPKVPDRQASTHSLPNRKGRVPAMLHRRHSASLGPEQLAHVAWHGRQRLLLPPLASAYLP